METMFSVAGRVACVTGASSGIGQAMASALAERGAKVVGVARRAEALEDWAAGGAGRAALAGDVSDLGALPELAGRVAEIFGPPDILIPAAGINPRRPAAEISIAEWQATMDINLSHPFFLAREMVPAMAGKGWGRVINYRLAADLSGVSERQCLWRDQGRDRTADPRDGRGLVGPGDHVQCNCAGVLSHGSVRAGFRE